jgi:hypothetical protein
VSLDSLTPEERREIDTAKARAKLLESLVDDTDKDISTTAKRLLKKKNPSLHFPDIEAQDAVEAATTKMREENARLQEELLRNRAQEALQNEDKKIRDADLDPTEVRKFMQEQHTTNLDLAIEVLQSRRALAEPSPAQFEPFKPPDIKEMWNDPSGWRQNEAYKVQAELRGAQRPLVRQSQ